MAISGAIVAWFFILDSGQVKYDEYMRNLGGSSTASIRFYLALDALLVLWLMHIVYGLVMYYRYEGIGRRA